MKVLAIGAPLSLQAHPDDAQAEQGFAAEEAAGVPLEGPTRNYRDERGKPEMLCALTAVEAFCGFRAVAETVALLGELDVPELVGLRESLSGPGLSDSIRWVFDLDDRQVSGTISALARSAEEIAGGPHVDALQWVSRLGDAYPDDRGVILSLLCEFIRLEPGQALVIPAGCLHGYLSGVGVEIMTESDNVLRGGLTAKHVDVVDLQRVLKLRGASPRVLHGESDAAGCTRFSSGVEEFDLSRYEITDAAVQAGNGARLILTVEGYARLRAEDGAVLDLPRGQSAFVAAVEKGVEISGPGVVFVATTALT